MDTFIEKSARVLSNKEMLFSYSKWCLRYLGITPSIKTIGGMIIGFTSFSEYWGTLCGVPDEREMLFIQKHIKDNNVIFDIGANIGVYTIVFSSYAKSGAIYAFEPVPQTLSQFQMNVKINGCKNVCCINSAVSDYSGSAIFSVKSKIICYKPICN